MQSLLQKLQSYNPSKISLKASCRENDLKISYLNQFSIRKARKIFKKLENMYEHNLKPIRCNWFENELKVFQFTLLFLSNIYRKKIMSFEEAEWNELKLTFRGKDMAELQYQAMNFVANKNILKKRWQEDEDNLLINFIKSQNDLINWNKIAISLFYDSNKLYFRTGKQCKERWLNHLDPQIKHGNWTFQEDKMLVEGVRKNGKRWALITKQFGNNRTQHMVKNRYISLILKSRKKYPDIVEEDQILEEICRDMLLGIHEDNYDGHNQKQKLRSNRKEKPIIEDEGDQMLKSSSLSEEANNKMCLKNELPQKQNILASTPLTNYPPNMIPFFTFQNYSEGYNYYPVMPNFMPNAAYFGF